MSEDYEIYKCKQFPEYKQCETCDKFGRNDSYNTKKCYQSIKDFYENLK